MGKEVDQEPVIVLPTDTLVHPDTMVVEFVDANPASVAMLCAGVHGDFADLALVLIFRGLPAGNKVI